jgi:iron complex outermembrane receptor protein
MLNRFYKKPLALLVSSLAMVAVDVNAAVLEEVIITAQKREQNLQDVGVSVSAFSGDQMKALGVTNTVDITQQVPGLQVNTWSPTLTTFNLRGVSQNNFTDNLEAPVAVYSDDVYIGSMNAISGQLFDVKRVEVLRGPQGTLFGRNATGGLIHYVSQDASDEELTGYVEASASEYRTRSIEGAVGAALSDTVRGRVSARVEEGDGYVKGTQPGVRALGGRDGYAVRGSLQVDFSDRLVADFSVKYSEDNDVATGGYVVYSGGGAAVDPVTGLGINDGTVVRPFEHDSEVQGRFDREASSFTAKFNYDLGDDMELVSITNYTDLDKFYTEDGDAFPVLAVNFTTIAEYEQYSQEFRVSGQGANNRWQVGAYFLQMNNINQSITEGIPGTIGACFGNLIPLPAFPGSTCFDYAPGGVGAPPGIEIPAGSANTQDVDMESTNWSLFGQYEHDLSDSLTVIAGYRWSQDDKEIVFTNTYANEEGVTTPVETFNAATSLDAAGLPDNDEIDYGGFAARLQLDWRVSEDTLMFFSYNRGIKGGNWSVNADVTAENFRHDEETLHSFEVGVKTEIGDLARINATVFYYDYKDYQSFSLTGLTPQVSNTDATVSGGEIELFLTPSVNWDIIFGASFLSSEIDQVFDANGGSIADNEMPNAPGYSFNFLGRYNWDMMGGNMAVQLDGAAYDDQFLEVTNSEVSEEDAYSVWNANVSYTSGDEAWRLTAFVKNITDEEYRIYNLDLGLLGSTSFYAPPRWSGVTLNYSW